MQDITLIGIDLGKHSFHVHGQDRHGKALLHTKFSRKQLIGFLAKFHVCTVGMEACAGAQCMARQLAGLWPRGEADLAAIRASLRQE
jgi:transposase